MENLPSPGLTVVIPTHSGRASVLDTVNAVLKNDYPTLEVLIVSDNAAERTRQLIGTLTDSRVRSLEKPKEGAAAARNHGLHAARYERVAFVDDDDLSRETWRALGWRLLNQGHT